MVNFLTKYFFFCKSKKFKEFGIRTYKLTPSSETDIASGELSNNLSIKAFLFCNPVPPFFDL